MKELSKQDIEVVLAGKALPGELMVGESLAKYFARLYLHTKDSRDEQLSQRDAQITRLTTERDALREEKIGKNSNTRDAADIYFQLIEECEIPPGGSLVQYVDGLKEQIAALKADFISLDKQMSVLEQTGIADRDRAQKAEAQIAALTAENVALKDFTLKARDAVENWNSWADEEDKILNEPETPATDAAANALRAEGVEWFATALAHEVMKSGEDYDSWKSAASNAAMDYANQLREGK